MSLPGKICVVTLALIAGSAWLPGASLLRAQSLEPFIDGDDLTVIYSKDNHTNVTVEKSADLLTWSATDSRDTVLESDADSQTIKSSVTIDQLGAMFIRLSLTQAWIVRLAWDAVPNPDVAGYRLYYYKPGEESAKRSLDVGNETSATVSLPEDAIVFSFTVTCYDIDGQESGPSNKLDVGHFWN